MEFKWALKIVYLELVIECNAFLNLCPLFILIISKISQFKLIL